MKIALCGNPNVGKTTLFNRITGADEPIGNWHGVTVGAATKRAKGDADTVITDLPGAYSLTSRSPDEAVMRDAVYSDEFDVVVYVAEANNLRRNLYLFTQLMEAEKRLVLVVNMMDEAKSPVDLKLLSERLGVEVIGASNKQPNPSKLIIDAAKRAKNKTPRRIEYLKNANCHRVTTDDRSVSLPRAYTELKAEEGDEYITERMGFCDGCGARYCLRPSQLRYGYIDKTLNGVTKRPSGGRTERIDKILLGRAALPFFFLIMTAVFVVTFEVGKPLSSLIERLIQCLKSSASAIPSPVLGSLVCDGIISGLGAVLAFLPQVCMLFILMSALGDSGYMSRIAFVTDGFFKKLGLSGRAAFSVILGLGCSATAVLSVRGESDKTVRTRTALCVPFMPCSARLAVFTATSAYFGFGGLFTACMYILGFFAGICLLLVIKAFSKNRPQAQTIMEMPPYRLPSIKRVLQVAAQNIASFIVRVGTVVFAVNIIIWALCSFSIPNGFTTNAEEGIMSTLCGIIAPVFAPLGFGTWQATAALISGVAAKESVCSVIATLGGFGSIFATPQSVASFTVFTCLYTPCVATVAALAKECGIKTATLSVAVHTIVAYTAAGLYYFSATAGGRDIRLVITVWTVVAAILACVVVAARIVLKKRKSLDGKN